jgi:hypothetical protein
MNMIMSKKLVYAELPDDYPKELDELFIFYWDTVQEMENLDYGRIEMYNKISENVDRMENSKRSRLAYLVWLANNSIPPEFSKFMSIIIS